jgi:hypothetical protein
MLARSSSIIDAFSAARDHLRSRGAGERALRTLHCQRKRPATPPRMAAQRGAADAAQQHLAAPARAAGSHHVRRGISAAEGSWGVATAARAAEAASRG